MGFLLLCTTGGWIGSALVLGLQGKANIGTLLVGLIIATLWLAYIAYILASKEPT